MAQPVGTDSPAYFPAGVTLRDLRAHADSRGTLTEFFRQEWKLSPPIVQWNLVHSEANILRGVHVHAVHHDHLLVMRGRMVLGLHDLRPDSPTKGNSVVIELSACDPRVIAIPPGVAHGFHFPEPATHIYGVSAYWDPADEMGCRWDDPGLGLHWQLRDPGLSDRDQRAGSLEDMRAAFCARCASLRP